MQGVSHCGGLLPPTCVHMLGMDVSCTIAGVQCGFEAGVVYRSAGVIQG